MLGEARTFEIDLGTGRGLTVRTTGRAVMAVKAIWSASQRGGEISIAGFVLEISANLPKLLQTGLVIGWRGFTDQDGRRLPLNLDLLAEVLTVPELEVLVGTIVQEAILTPAAVAAAEEGIEDPTPTEPEPTFSTSSSATS